MNTSISDVMAYWNRRSSSPVGVDLFPEQCDPLVYELCIDQDEQDRISSWLCTLSPQEFSHVLFYILHNKDVAYSSWEEFMELQLIQRVVGNRDKADFCKLFVDCFLFTKLQAQNDNVCAAKRQPAKDNIPFIGKSLFKFAITDHASKGGHQQPCATTRNTKNKAQLQSQPIGAKPSVTSGACTPSASSLLAQAKQEAEQNRKEWSLNCLWDNKCWTMPSLY